MKDTKEPSRTESLKRRHRKRVRRRNVSIMLKQVIIAVLIAAVALTLLLYLNPLFNIKQVMYEGNERVSKDYLDKYCEDVIGENVFQVSRKKVMEDFKPINYIEDVVVKKKFFPPALKVIIHEAKPYGCVKVGERYIMIDKDLKNLEESSSFIDGAPKIYGLEDVPDAEFVPGSKNKTVQTMMEVLAAMADTGSLEHITEISFENISDIKFDYDQYDVTLGSAFDAESKLLLLQAAVNSADASDNTSGTVDLSTAGMAYLRP